MTAFAFPTHRLAAAALIAVSSISSAFAATGADIYDFQGGKEGDKPVGTLVVDATNTMYGNTMWGGLPDAGTFYEMTPAADGSWTHTLLFQYSAQNPAGFWPVAGLVKGPDGALYGMTTRGASGAFGSVFRLVKGATSWKPELLHAFDFDAEGGDPSGPVAFDAAGNLYGTLQHGGPGGNGSVFMLQKKGNKSVYKTVWQFAGAPNDGATPGGQLAVDPSGVVYGIAQAGGTFGLGAVWRLTPGKKPTLDLIANFRGDNGMLPIGGVTLDAKGNLFGTASGGASTGGGVVFELTPDGTAFDYTVLHTFANGTEGWQPAAPVLLNAKGVIFGTTTSGGTGGGGTVFKLVAAKDGSYALTTLYSLSPSANTVPDGLAFEADGKTLVGSATYGTGVIGDGGFQGNLIEIKQ